MVWGLAKIFLNRMQKVEAIKKKINKQDFTKISIFCSSKPTIRKNERASHKLGENIGQTAPTKDLDLEYKVFLQVHNKKTYTILSKCAENLSRYFTKEDI